MLSDLTFAVNVSYVDKSEFMQLEIQPEQQLEPIYNRPASEQPALTYLAGLGRSSQRVQWGALCVVAAVLTAGHCDPLTLPWQALRRAHVNAVRAWLIDNRSVATGSRILSALRGCLQECARLDLMTYEQYARAVDIKPIKGSKPSQAAGRALSAGEIGALLICCKRDQSAAGPRDAAILGLGVCCGLRRAEIAALSLEHYDPAQSAVTVLGKGRKIRKVYLTAGVARALTDWLSWRGAEPGPLFGAINRGGRIYAPSISGDAIYQMLSKRAAAAGVSDFSPHDLRRTFAGDMLEAGADISTVQQIMGHASVATTASYDRRGERAKQSAAARLHFAW